LTAIVAQRATILPAQPAGPSKADGARGVLADRTRELTAAIARGDTSAFETFYNEWFDPAYLIALRITRRDESFCLDVVHETMLRAIRSIRPLSTRSDAQRWLTRVVHTAAIDLLRREARRARRERERAPADAAASPGDGAELLERIGWLRREVAKLPPSDRTLLSLRLSGKTLRAAGEATGLSEGAAQGRIRRAMKRLRQRARESFDE
jgi:RNA polymerase sigma-70 factor (ECF subfamily)